MNTNAMDLSGVRKTEKLGKIKPKSSAIGLWKDYKIV